MNLFSLASKAIGAVNPNVNLSVQRSTGYTTAGDGKRTPTYAAAVTISAQVQQLTTKELAQLSGLDIQSQTLAIYVPGELNGANRAEGIGGDLVTFPDGSVWLAVQILENWGDATGWAKVAITLQNRA